MKNLFFDVCYELLSHYLDYSDVADTFKSINDGLHYRDNFPWNMIDFQQKKGDIISYIEKVRLSNIIDAYREKENPLIFVPVPSGRLLSQAMPDELYNNLTAEIPRLILKGTHQAIKHLYIVRDDNELTAELLQQDITVLRKYGLVCFLSE